MDRILLLCYIIWTCSCLYSFVAVYNLSNDFLPHLGSDLSESDILQGSFKDSSDLEWQVFLNLFTSTYHWIALYVIVSTCPFCRLKQQVQIVFSLLFIICQLSLGVLIVFTVISSCIICCALVFRSRLLQCVVILSFLLILHSNALVELKHKLLSNDANILLFDVCSSWLLAKLMSFSMDCISGKPVHRLLLVDYLLYFPTLFTGPIHLYHQFERKQSSLASRSLRLLQLVRIIVYGLLLELTMHLIYVNAIQYHHDKLTSVGGWSFFGFGYLVTVIFYLKYLVLFGFAHELAAVDGVAVASPPTCVSIVCRSLLLWKTFDRGLYTWLLHYFYIPLSDYFGAAKYSKLPATAACFMCVALWHSLHSNIVIWCTVNFISVIIERALDMSTISYRVNCLISSPLFAAMVISNICFLTNEYIAYLFVQRLFIFPIPLVPVLIVMYAGARVSFHQLNYNSSKQ